MTIYDGLSADPSPGEPSPLSGSADGDDAVARGAVRLAGHLILALGVVVVLSGLATVGFLTTLG